MEPKRKRGLLSKLLVVQLAAVSALFAGVLGTSAVVAGTSISAGSASMVAGNSAVSTASVTRSAEDAHFNAYDITLQFDPAIVSVASVEAAAGWSLMPAPRIKNDVGTVQVIAVRFDTCATTCPVFKVTWNGLSAGTSALTLGGNANESLAGMGQYIPATFSAGSVTVTAPATPTATPTNPPSSTPTAPPSPSATATPSPTASPTATPPAPATPAPGAPAAVLAGSGGAVAGASFLTTAGVSLGTNTPSPASFDLTLRFDPAVATVERVTAGNGWSLAPQPAIDNAAGKVRVSGLRFDSCAAYCPLFVVEWNAVAAGSSVLQIEGNPNQVLGANGANQPANFTPGWVTVTATAPSATPVSAPATPTPTQPAGPNAAEVPVMPHSPGWNLLTWGGEEMAPSAAIAASNPAAIEVIYVWDAEAGRWRRYGPGLPGYLNDLKTLKSGDIIWLSARD